jgi:hypothetical protein
MVKWALAAIPAACILFLLAFGLSAMLNDLIRHWR